MTGSDTTASSSSSNSSSSPSSIAEHFDVVIVGAGLSGLASAYYLQQAHPSKRIVVLESRRELGGTWSLFRYPGIRSDSDMFTLGFSFRPWSLQQSIAAGGDILQYLRDTAKEFDLEKHIRFKHRVIQADFNTKMARWNLTIETGGPGDPDEQLRSNPPSSMNGKDATDCPIKTLHITCGFLLLCSGYYRYSHGYTPDFPGCDSFRGQFIHPQLWPEQCELKNKKIVVIGSGATAVTLVPALAAAQKEGGTAASVTMLQRSPTYMISLPTIDPLFRLLTWFLLPTWLVYHVMRWKNILFGLVTFWFSRTFPSVVKWCLRQGMLRVLPANFDVDKHMTPTYNPWEQRFCLVPDGDLFRVLQQQQQQQQHHGAPGNGKTANSTQATVSPSSTAPTQIVTDTIIRFTPGGILLSSGVELSADVIVSATGLHMEMGGGMSISLDGSVIKLGECVMYRGSMLSDIPNLCVVMGYTNASWTLKCELIARRFCEILQHMDATHTDTCTPILTEQQQVNPRNLLDFSSSYIRRAHQALPKQGDRDPWKLNQHYVKDLINLRMQSIEDGVLQFTRRTQRNSTPSLNDDDSSIRNAKKEL